jgi:hypothetical protein
MSARRSLTASFLRRPRTSSGGRKPRHVDSLLLDLPAHSALTLPPTPPLPVAPGRLSCSRRLMVTKGAGAVSRPSGALQIRHPLAHGA